MSSIYAPLTITARAPAGYSSPDFASYNDWSVDNANDPDELTNRAEYADYVRKQYIANGNFDDPQNAAQIEESIRQNTREAAIADEVEGAAERMDSLFAPKAQPIETKLAFIKQYSDSNSEEWKSAEAYLAHQTSLTQSGLEGNENPLTEERTLQYQQEAEALAGGAAYQKALRAAVDRGDMAMARLTDEDGQSYIHSGKLLDTISFKDAIQQSVAMGGMAYSDAAAARSLYSVDAKYNEPYHKVRRWQEQSNVLEKLSLKNKDLGKSMQGLQALYAEMEDDGEKSPEFQAKEEAAIAKVYESMISTGAYDKDTTPDFEDISRAASNMAQMNNFYNGEAEAAESENVGKNIRRIGYNNLVMHPAAMLNKKMFDASIKANQDLTPSEINMLTRRREFEKEQNFSEYNERLANDSVVGDKWITALQIGRTNGQKDADTLDEFINNEDNYSSAKGWLSGIWSSVEEGVSDLAAAVGVMTGNTEWALPILQQNARDKASRREMSALFGKEYGFGRNAVEMLAPVLTDMAATALLSIPTAGAGGAGYLIAKQGATLTAKGIAKGLVTNTFRRGATNASGVWVRESVEEASERLVTDKLIRGSSETVKLKGAKEALDSFNNLTARRWGVDAAVFVPASTRSGGMTYGSVYTQLQQDNPDATHEENHDKAMGAAMQSGLMTGLTTVAFGRLGFGGVEDALVRGATYGQLKRVLEPFVKKTGTTFDKAVRGAYADAMKQTGMFGLRTGLAKVGLKGTTGDVLAEGIKGAVSEAPEEALQEFLDGLISDAATDSETPFAERISQSFNAALYGAVLGGGITSGKSLATAGKQLKIDQQVAPQMLNSFEAKVAAKLEESGSPLMAEQVRSVLFSTADTQVAAFERARQEFESDQTQAPFMDDMPVDQPAAPEPSPERQAVRAELEQAELEFDAIVEANPVEEGAEPSPEVVAQEQKVNDLRQQELELAADDQAAAQQQDFAEEEEAEVDEDPLDALSEAEQETEKRLRWAEANIDEGKLSNVLDVTASRMEDLPIEDTAKLYEMLSEYSAELDQDDADTLGEIRSYLDQNTPAPEVETPTTAPIQANVKRLSDTQITELERASGESGDVTLQGRNATVLNAEDLAAEIESEDRIEERVIEIMGSSDRDLNESFVRRNVTKSATALAKKLRAGIQETAAPQQETTTTPQQPIKLKGFGEGNASPKTANSDAAVEEINNLGTASPTEDGSIIIDGNVQVNANSVNGVIKLDTIKAIDQGQGDGTRVLESIKEIARENGVKVEVIPEQIGSTSVEDLVTWYESKGFVSEGNNGQMVFDPLVEAPTDVEVATDQAERQQLINAIAEGGAILKSGQKTNGEPMTEGELEVVQRSVDNASARLGYPSSLSAAIARRGVTEEAAAPEPLTSRQSNFLREQVVVNEGDPRYDQAKEVSAGTGVVRVVEQNNLAELVDSKPVYHETNLTSAKQLIQRVEAGDRRLDSVYVTDNIDIALGQAGRGYVMEFDSTKVNGSVADTMASQLAEDGVVEGTELILDTSVRGSLQAIIVPNQRGLNALAKVKGIEKRFDLDNATQVERGIRIPRRAPDPVVEQEAEIPAVTNEDFERVMGEPAPDDVVEQTSAEVDPTLDPTAAEADPTLQQPVDEDPFAQEELDFSDMTPTPEQDEQLTLFQEEQTKMEDQTIEAQDAAENLFNDRSLDSGVSQLENDWESDLSADEILSTVVETAIPYIRDRTPSEVDLVIDETISAPMRMQGNKMTVNPWRIGNEIAKMGGDGSNTGRMLDSIMSEETAHYGGFMEFDSAKVDEMATAVGVDELSSVAQQYYNENPAMAEESIKKLRSEDPAIAKKEAATMVEEQLRMKLQRATRGFTTEEDVLFLRSNPSMFETTARYFEGGINRIAANFDLKTNPNSVVNGQVNKMVAQMRSIKARHRMGNAVMTFNPNNPNQGLDTMFAMQAETANIEEQLGMRELATSTGKSEDKSVFSMRSFAFDHTSQMFEVPLMETGGYNPPSNLFAKYVLGDPDVRLTRLHRIYKSLNRQGGSTIKQFDHSFKKLLTATYGEDHKAYPHEDIATAIGSNAGVNVPKETLNDLEEQLDQNLQAVDADPTIEYADKKLAKQVEKQLHQNRIEVALKAEAQKMRDAQRAAMERIQKDSPELARHMHAMRTELIDTLSGMLKDDYNLGGALGIQVDANMGLYITRSYKMFTDLGYRDKLRESLITNKKLSDAALADMDTSNMTDEEVVEAAKGSYDDLQQEGLEFFEQSTLESIATDPARIKEFMDGGMSERDAQAEAYVTARDVLLTPEYRDEAYNALLQFVDEYANPDAQNVIASTAGYKVLMDNLREKKDIPEQLRKILGENTDQEQGVNNLLRTYATVFSMVNRQSFLRNIVAVGTASQSPNPKRSDKFLMTPSELTEARAEDPETYDLWRPVRGDAKVSEFDPLGNLWGPPDMIDHLNAMTKPYNQDQNMTSNEKLGDSLTKFLHKLTGLSMATKTLGSVSWAQRNMIGNLTVFPMMNGWFRPDKIMKQAKLVWRKRNADEAYAVDAEIQELVGLDILESNMRMTIMKDLLRGTGDVASLQEEINELTSQEEKLELAGKAGKAWDKTKKIGTRIAELGDSIDGFYKMAYFYNELEILTEAQKKEPAGSRLSQMSPYQLKQEAADKVNRTSQSASYRVAIAQSLSSSPLGLLIAPFIGFTADMFRVPVGIFKLATEEMKSGNSVLMKRGQKRMTGLLGTLTTTAALPTVFAQLFGGLDDEDRTTLTEALPPFLKGHSIYYFKMGDELKQIDLTYTNPVAMIVDPSLRGVEQLMKGEYSQATIAMLKGYLGDTFLNEQILAGTVASWWRNKDDLSGKPIYDQRIDNFGEIAMKTFKHIYEKAYEPDTFKRLKLAGQRLGGDDEGIPSNETALGVLASGLKPAKWRDVDLQKEFTRLVYAEKEAKSAVRDTLNGVFRKKPMNDDTIADFYRDYYEDEHKLNTRMYKFVKSFTNMGVDEGYLRNALIKSGYGKRRVNTLLNGYTERPSLTPQMMKNLEDRGLVNRAGTLYQTYMQSPEFRQIE